MWKRILALSLAVLMMIMTAACAGDGGQQTAEDQEILVWMPSLAPDGNDKEVWGGIVKPFEEENNVKVNFEFISWKDYEAKYASGIQMGNGPDVGYLYVEMFPDYIDAGLVEPIEDYLTQEDRDDYLYLEAGKIWDRVYGLPLSIGNPVALFYNQDILDSIGESAPETWEDVRRIAQKATADTDGDGKIDQWGLAQGWGQSFSQDLNWNWYSFVFQAGGDLFDEKGRVIMDQEPAVEAATFLYDLKNTDHALPEDCMAQTNSEMFANYFITGKAAMSFGGVNLANAQLLDGKDSDFEYGFTLKLKNKIESTRCGLDQMVVMSAAPDKELAAKLIKYMTGPVGNGQWHQVTQGAPVSRSEENHAFPMLKEALEGNEDIVRPLTPALRAPQVYEYLWKALQEMMNGNSTPEETMKDVTEYGNSLPYERQSDSE